jgi:hypothetical protein
MVPRRHAGMLQRANTMYFDSESNTLKPGDPPPVPPRNPDTDFFEVTATFTMTVSGEVTMMVEAPNQAEAKAMMDGFAAQAMDYCGLLENEFADRLLTALDTSPDGEFTIQDFTPVSIDGESWPTDPTTPAAV